MEKLIDAVNVSPKNKFAQIPNTLIRSPELSAKAKAILCILLSNREGWKSCIETLTSMMKEGLSAIHKGLKELEENGYLRRIKYREKNTKSWKGSFWAYTDSPNKFNIEKQIVALEKEGLEIALYGKPLLGFPLYGKSHTKNTNNKNTKKDIMCVSPENDSLPIGKDKSKKISPINKKITPSKFDKFWELYPSNANKGQAKTKWNALCASKECPTWKEIKKAVLLQKKSEKWKAGFVPHPTTWINQRRWLDDPKEMKVYDYSSSSSSSPKNSFKKSQNKYPE